MPDPTRGAAVAEPLGSTGPVGIRRGFEVLGLGIRASGMFVRRKSRRRSLVFAGALLLALAAITIIVIRSS